MRADALFMFLTTGVVMFKNQYVSKDGRKLFGKEYGVNYA